MGLEESLEMEVVGIGWVGGIAGGESVCVSVVWGGDWGLRSR